MTYARLTRLVIVLLFSAVIILLQQPGVSDSSFGPGELLTISDDTDNEGDALPAIAFNSRRQEYLVVWWGGPSGCSVVKGRLIDSNGEFLGDPYLISPPCPETSVRPDVTYNPVQDEYLVVFQQYNPGGTYNTIGAQRLSSDGQLIDDGYFEIHTPLSVSSQVSYAEVAYSSVSDRYLVIYFFVEHEISNDYVIMGRMVTSEGVVDGDEFTIGEGEDGRYGDLAYDSQTDRFLVIWQADPDISGSQWAIYGQVVQGNGTLYQGTIEVMVNPGANSVNASVAALSDSPNADKFLVVYQSPTSPSNIDVHGVFLTKDGVVSPPLTITTGSLKDDMDPAVVALTGPLQYVVTWSKENDDDTISIMGQVLNYDGTPLADTAEAPGRVTEYLANAAGTGGNFMAVWHDDPDDDFSWDVYGQQWVTDHLLYTPVIVNP